MLYFLCWLTFYSPIKRDAVGLVCFWPYRIYLGYTRLDAFFRVAGRDFQLLNNFLIFFTNMGIMFVLISSIIEVVLVISLAHSIYKLNSKSALMLFFGYSVINGITLSSIFFLYDLSSIIYVFLGSAAIFGIMCLVGYTTKLDLSKLGTFITISLISMLTSPTTSAPS